MTDPAELEQQLTEALAGRAAAASPPADGWDRIVARSFDDSADESDSDGIVEVTLDERGAGRESTRRIVRRTLAVIGGAAAAVILAIVLFSSAGEDSGEEIIFTDDPEAPDTEAPDPDTGVPDTEAPDPDTGVPDTEAPDLRPARLIAPGSWSVAGSVAGDTSLAQLEAAGVEIQSWPGVLEVAIAADGEAWRRLTGLGSDGCSSGVGEPPCGPGLVLRAVEGQAEPVARRLESELAMTTLVAHLEPWIALDGYLAAVIDRASPVPLRFDPSPLGREVELTGPFVDVGADDGCLTTTCPVAVDLEVGETVHRVSISVVSPDDVSLEDEQEFNDRPIVALGFSERGATGTGFFQATDLLPGSGGAIGIVGGGIPFKGERRSVIVAGLPVEAAVVTTQMSDGSTVWQRPLAGMAVLADAVGTWSPNDGFPFGSMTVLDADGNEILLIEGADGFVHLVTDLRVDAEAVAQVAVPLPGPDDVVEAAGLTVTWTEASLPEGAGWPAVSTKTGILGARRNGDVVRWVDGATWTEVSALSDISVSALTDGTDFVLASGIHRSSGKWVLLHSADGQTWTTIDRTALDDTERSHHVRPGECVVQRAGRRHHRQRPTHRGPSSSVGARQLL
jgi:hypothetical protein